MTRGVPGTRKVGTAEGLQTETTPEACIICTPRNALFAPPVMARALASRCFNPGSVHCFHPTIARALAPRCFFSRENRQQCHTSVSKASPLLAAVCRRSERTVRHEPQEHQHRTSSRGRGPVRAEHQQPTAVAREQADTVALKVCTIRSRCVSSRPPPSAPETCVELVASPKPVLNDRDRLRDPPEV